MPHFENGEYINAEGTLFYSEAFEKSQKKIRDIELMGQTAFIGSINCLRTHDGQLAGGPELKFIWGHIGFTGKGAVNTATLKLTKNEIGKTKDVNICIQSSWPSWDQNNYLLILERDGGKDKTMTKMLKRSFGGEEVVPVTIPYQANDDFLFDQILERSDIFSDKNKPFGQWKQYHGDDFWFTLPTK